MYKIVFYQDKKGISSVKEYIDELNQNYSNKDNRVKLKKITAYLDNNKFVLLTCFMKKTQKTPKKEIEKAKRLLKEYKRR